MKNTITLFLLIAIAIGFNSCSDEDTGTTPEEVEPQVIEYPLAVGNEWVYEEVFTDLDGNVTEKSGTKEVHKIERQVTLFGHTGYEIIRTKIFEGASSEIDTTYMYDDETGIYTYDPKVSRDISDEFPELRIEWVKLVDYNQSSWVTYATVVDTTLSNGVEYKSYYTTTGVRSGTRKITIQEKEFEAKVFTITIKRASYTPSGPSFNTRTYEQLIIDKIGTFKETETGTSGNGSWGLSLISYTLN